MLQISTSDGFFSEAPFVHETKYSLLHKVGSRQLHEHCSLVAECKEKLDKSQVSTDYGINART